MSVRLPKKLLLSACTHYKSLSTIPLSRCMQSSTHQHQACNASTATGASIQVFHVLSILNGVLWLTVVLGCYVTSTRAKAGRCKAES